VLETGPVRSTIRSAAARQMPALRAQPRAGEIFTSLLPRAVENPVSCALDAFLFKYLSSNIFMPFILVWIKSFAFDNFSSIFSRALE
jgi:hypothetical protein